MLDAEDFSSQPQLPEAKVQIVLTVDKQVAVRSPRSDADLEN